VKTLTNEAGVDCVTLNTFPVDGETWAAAVSWRAGVGGLPDVREWNDAIDEQLAQCREKGAKAVATRVITAAEGVVDALAAARAALHRDSIVARGFHQGEERVEYRMPLAEALAALEKGQIASRLTWTCVDGKNEAALAQAAECLRRAAEGDPASDPDSDAVSFLATLLADEETVQAPERIQIGTCDGAPAAMLVLMVSPSSGWSSIYYMGVLPDFRGRGFGVETMLHAFRCLTAMGGKTYHDGTGSRNAPARALFARLGRPPFLVMEEWKRGE
jgi:GNAT superfamily N-acetyltransferase